MIYGTKISHLFLKSIVSFRNNCLRDENLLDELENLKIKYFSSTCSKQI